ncbi:putative Protein kinase domain-containing protein [Seiridium cardinale]|uniref:Protein kinase domain-containing protein n=1 Tax=Seiridium cardinale TaxID=138064 RepID=A0ABR2Y518_9PEZI
MNKAVSSCRLLGVSRSNTKGGTVQVWPVSTPESLAPHARREQVSHSKYKDPDHGESLSKRSPKATTTSSVRKKTPMQPCKATLDWFALFSDLAKATSSSFDNPQPHFLREDILQFWKPLFNVAAALKEVHGLRYRNEYGQDEDFDGWHADIKLDNILRVQDLFKLADFEFVKSKRKARGLTPKNVPEEPMQVGTETHGQNVIPGPYGLTSDCTL